MNDQNTRGPKGLGCPPDDGSDGPAGACGSDGPGCDDSSSRKADVYRLLRLGSSRLALARARCVPFQPTVSSVRATFSATTVTDVANIGADQQFSQDTLIDGVDYTITNKSATANSNILQPLSDYFFGLQSGMEAKLQIGKSPFYGVFPNFTPIATLIRMVKADTTWPSGWVLGKTEQITMSFHAGVTLPTAPIEVVVSFLGQIPKTDEFEDGNMTKKEALAGLGALGYDVSGYSEWCCR